MARRLTVVALLAALFAFVACSSSSSSKAAAGFDTRTITVGSVDVTITPTRVNAAGAEFDVAFDTHTDSLDLEVADVSTLAVNNVQWTAPTWSGDGPGGHHRAGVLRFTAAGTASGMVELTIGGLSGPVTASWQFPVT